MDGKPTLIHGGSRFAPQLESMMELVETEAAGENIVQNNTDVVKLKSFCSIERVASTFNGLDDSKKSLIRAIGFEGLLKLPIDAKIDENLCFWLLRNLDTASMSLKTPFGETLPIKDVDVHLVLGVPFIGDQVIDENQINPNGGSAPKYDSGVVSTVHSLLFNNDANGSLTLDYLQEVITREYGQTMTDSEVIAFKIAVVLFSMGCFYAVYNTKMMFPIWLLRNFIDPEKISGKNWSGYLLSIAHHAAKEVQDRAKKGKTNFNLYGCLHMLQVFYLDNLEMGKLKTLHMDLPRICVFNCDQLMPMVEAERKGQAGKEAMEFGNHKLRSSKEICYTRGWDAKMLLQWDNANRNREQTTDELHRILRGQPRTGLVTVLHNLGADCAMAIKLSYNTLHADYKPTAEPCESSTAQELVNEGLLLSPGDIVSNALNNTMNSRKRKACFKKDITVQGNFDESPFNLLYSHPGVLRHKRMLVYEYIKEELVGVTDLGRNWYNHKVPTPLKLTGLDIKAAFVINGTFSVKVVDAIMRCYTYLDNWMYKFNNDHMNNDPEEMHWNWRHFLPASFSKAVLSGEDYLGSEYIRAKFIGDHIKYNIANCTMFVIPVLLCGRWSCYFWNFETRTISVLDPLMMNYSSVKAEYIHSDNVEALHIALMDCIEMFFVGWNVERGGWARRYPTDLGPRCKIANSGLYMVHYGRSFDGNQLNWPLRDNSEVNLSEPRSELLYFLLTMEGNEGYMPLDLMEAIHAKKRFWRRHF